MTMIKRAIEIALADAAAGKGEVRNNWGPDIFEYRRTDGTGRRVTGKGSWCASSLSSVMLRAVDCVYFSRTLKRPAWAAWRHPILALGFATSRGARRLTRNAAESDVAAWSTTNAQEALEYLRAHPEAQGVISWKRKSNGKWHPWKGHVEMFFEFRYGQLGCVGGNHRKKGEKLAFMSTHCYTDKEWMRRFDRLVVL